MPGSIENSTKDALFSSYAQGRALAGKSIPESSQYAQWSSVLDASTCDFCGWADERIFDISFVPYDPPMHFGCRCLIAYISKDEFEPTPDWGDGPPGGAFPPGTKGGTGKGGKPVLRNEGLKPKPRVGAQGRADEIAGTFDKDEWINLKPSGKVIKYDGIKDWRDNWMKEMLADEYDEAADFVIQMAAGDWANYVDDDIRRLFAKFASGDVKMTDIQRFLDLAEEFDMPTSSVTPELFLKHWEAQREISRGALKAVYGDELTLYRGVRKDFAEKIGKLAESGDLEWNIGTNAIESWTVNPNVAMKFADMDPERSTGFPGIVFKKTIKTEDVEISFLDNSMFLESEAEVLWRNFETTLVPKQVDPFDADGKQWWITTW